MLIKNSILLLASSFSLLLASPILNLGTWYNTNISMIINKISLERKIERLVIISSYKSSKYCISKEDLKSLSHNKNIILERADTSLEYFGRKSRNTLIIRCLAEPFEYEMLDKMLIGLDDTRSRRILFIWRQQYTNARTLEERRELQEQQEKLFKYCALKRLLNVIAIYQDYARDRHFYTFSYFPQFHVQHKSLDRDKCFPNRLKNLEGYPIRICPNLIKPWSLVWRDPNGHVEISGFAVKALELFAERHNATLTYPLTVKPNKWIDWEPLLKNDTIDIVAGLTPFNIENISTSDVLLISDWIIMLPMAQIIPYSDTIWIIINSVLGLFLLLLLFVFSLLLTLEGLLWQRHKRHTFSNIFTYFAWILTNVVLRSVIGWPSYGNVHPSTKFITRFIYLLLFLSGMFINTFISGGIQSYLTSSSRYPRIHSFDDLFNSEVKLILTARAAEFLKLNFFSIDSEKLDQIISIETFENKEALRSAMDTRFAYTLFSHLWAVYEIYQSHLKEPRFYINENLVISKQWLLYTPMQKYSIYLDEFNNMINEIHSVGLIKHWIDQLYGDMIAAGMLNKTSIIYDPVNTPLNLEDFYWVYWVYGVGICLSILVFCVEILYNYIMRKKKVILKPKIVRKRINYAKRRMLRMEIIRQQKLFK